MHLGRVSNESLVVIDLSTSGVSFVSELVQTSLFKKKTTKKNRNHIYLNHFFLILFARILLENVSLPLNSGQ